MKCQNCGKNECSFHYTYSVNGRTSEVHLCSECADKLGYSDNVFFNTDSLFEDMVSGFFGRRRSLDPFAGFGLMPSVSAIMPRLTVQPVERRHAQSEPVREQPSANQSVDPEIAKRREINMLREQMKNAAAAEDYEKAAEIRDKLKELEKND
ncbi:MAG: UvrB/UvrC motif-containing protein [Oscillospiraceae bacterium]|nr:UvrB/UvrC motif-containing protein [Oscillospiraceae bacterium]